MTHDDPMWYETSEPWEWVPFDPTPYGPLDTADPQTPPGLGGGSAVSSVSVAPAASAGGTTPAETLPLCPNCLVEVDTDLYCGGCGRLLIDRGSRAAIQEDPRAAEGDPC